MFELMRDLKGLCVNTELLLLPNYYHLGMGESNATHQRPNYIRRDTLTAAAALYKSKNNSSPAVYSFPCAIFRSLR